MSALDPRAVIIVGKALEVGGGVEGAGVVLRAAVAALDAIAQLEPAASRGDLVRHDTLAAEMNITPREAAALVRRVPGARKVARRWVVSRAALAGFIDAIPRSVSRPANDGSPIDRELADLGFGPTWSAR